MTNLVEIIRNKNWLFLYNKFKKEEDGKVYSAQPFIYEVVLDENLAEKEDGKYIFYRGNKKSLGEFHVFQFYLETHDMIKVLKYIRKNKYIKEVTNSWAGMKYIPGRLIERQDKMKKI